MLLRGPEVPTERSGTILDRQDAAVRLIGAAEIPRTMFWEGARRKLGGRVNSNIDDDCRFYTDLPLPLPPYPSPPPPPPRPPPHPPPPYT
eukprot:1323640-Pyramimonas_sp.AAC.1